MSKSTPLWMYEMKKMFLLHKGLLFIGLFIVFNMASLIFLDKPANPDIEMNLSQYDFYLNQVKGPYTESTEHFFTEEAARISDAKVALQKATDDYYDGNMKEDQFKAVSGPLEKTLQNEKGFKLVYDQYTYVRENPGNRYFLGTNGWDGLLSTDQLDFLTVLLLLLLVTPVFCFEFESRMSPLILTVKKGARYHAVCKIGLVMLTVIVLSLATAGMRYGFYLFKYGLDDGSYPLQSLSYFAASGRKLTLLETFLATTACKLFGNLCFAMIIMFVSVLIKKYAFTLFTCLALILLPYYGFRLESAKYFLPGPLGFMVSTGFFRGNEFKRNPIKDELDIVFQQVPSTVCWILFTVTLCLCVGFFCVTLIRQTNVWSAGKRSQRMKGLPLMIFFVVVVSVLSGCTSADNAGKGTVYNFSSRQSYSNERYQFSVDDTDPNQVRIRFKDKRTGETHVLNRNPMTSLTKVMNTIYGNGSHVYYIQYDFEKSGLREEVDRFSVIEADTTNFNERIIYEKNLNSDHSHFLGLKKANEHDTSFFLSISSFFVDEQNLYFIGEDDIRRVNRITGDMSVIIRFPVMRSTAFDGRAIYYVNEKSQVVAYDTKTDSEKIIPGVITRYFVLIDQELLFLNRKDRQKIYAVALADHQLRKITERSATDFTWDGQHINYIDKADHKKYQVDKDGQQEMLVE